MNANPPSFKSRWQRAIGESALPSGVRHVLQTISIHFMDENGGSCYPAIDDDLVRVSGLKRRSVIDHLKCAVDAGWLKRWHFGKGRANRRWNYQATIPEGGIVESRPDDLVQNLNQHPDEIVQILHQHPDEIVQILHQHPDEIVQILHHKPCRDITMQRESNHSRARARTCAAETAASGSETAPPLSVKEKNRMTKLTDALMERAKKTVRQRGIREDLSDTAISHSIEKCQAQKGYLEMTEAAWIETLVQWVGKERAAKASTTRSEPFSSQEPVQVSPEEKARRDAEYEARMAHAGEQHQARLQKLGILGQATKIDPVQAMQALADKVNVKPSAAPAPVQIPLRVMQNVAPRRPEGQAKELADLLMAMSKAGSPANDIAAINDAVIAAGDQWRSVIVAGWNALGKCPKEAAA